MSYEQLDIIADLYNPLLLFAAIIYIVIALKHRNFHQSAKLFFTAVLNILFVYGIRLLDSALNLWPRLDLDYSTHTAFAIALVISYSKHHIFWWLSLISYFGLMYYQNYHTLADIISTASIVIPLFLLIQKIYFYFTHRHKQE